MPQGKGTYGSAVGRPPKKEKYQGGGSIDPFSTKNPDSFAVKQALEEMKDQADIPTSNAMERNETSPMGAEVGTGVYKGGGFVKKAIGKLKDKSRMKKLEKSLKGPDTPKGHQSSERELEYLKQKGKEPTHKITGITKPKKKGLKSAKVPSNPPLFKGDTTKEKILNTSILYNMGKKAGKKKTGKKKVEAGK